MRAVLLAMEDPWDRPHGGTLRSRALAETLAGLGHDATCVFPAPRDRELAASGVRRLAVAAEPAGNRAYPQPLKRLKQWLLPMPTALGARSRTLREALAGLGGADLFVAPQLPYVGYADALEGARLWLDHADLFSGFAATERERRRGVARVTTGFQQRQLVSSEITWSTRAAVTTAAGWSDAELLERRIHRPVTWLPTPIRAPQQSLSRRSAGRPAAGFLANFAFHPNVDALNVLVDRWAPALQARGWDVVVAGLQSDQLELPPSIHLLGPVDTPSDFYEHVDVTVSPIRIGGGIKVKVLESLMYGRPVVASPRAIEGLPPETRDAVMTVDLHEPDFDGLDTLPSVSPEQLRRAAEPFGFEAFESTVAALVQGVSVP